MQVLIGTLLRELLKKLSPELVKELVDVILDKLETKVTETETKWDDTLIMPLISTIRSVANIDDKKYGDDKENASS